MSFKIEKFLLRIAHFFNFRLGEEHKDDITINLPSSYPDNGFVELAGFNGQNNHYQWSRPCLMLGPIIDELSNEYTNVKIGKMDADENQDTMKLLGIRSIPTILIYKNGEIVEKHVGSASKSQLKSLIDKHLN